jgi:trimeric autotransporter adhesin
MNTNIFRRAFVGLLAASLVCGVSVGCGRGAGAGTAGAGNPASTVTSVAPATPATPAITQVSPSTAVAGGADFQITISGSGFVPTSVVEWNGAPRPAVLSDIYLVVTISAADIAQPGVAQITVRNSSNTSTAFNFPVSEFRLASISPPTALEGSGGTTLVLSGAGFTSGTVVRWNGSDRPTVFVSPSTVSVSIPASDLLTANVAEIAVATPAPQNKISNQLLFPITVADSVGYVERISLGSAGEQVSLPSSRPATSDDGRFVTYLQGSTNNGYKVLLRDTCWNADPPCGASTTVASLALNGLEETLISQPGTPALSFDGRFVAFGPDLYTSIASPGQVEVHDTCVGAPAGCVPSTFVSVRNQSGNQFVPFSAEPSLSAGGGYLVFTGGEFGGYGFDSAQVFLVDTCDGALTGCSSVPASVATDEDGNPLYYAVAPLHSLSSDGRYIAYTGNAGLTYATDNDGTWLHDTCRGSLVPCTPASIRLSFGENGARTNNTSESLAVSATGRYVAFAIGGEGIFLRDTCLGAAAGCFPSTVRVSVNSSGHQFRQYSYGVSISDDGRRVAWVQNGTDSFGQRGFSNVLVRYMCNGAAGCTPMTFLVSHAADGAPANGVGGSVAMISASGQWVVFDSAATNLVPDDTNGVTDIFRAPPGPVR